MVCPECGAPHHRACYKQLGHCAMEQQLHPQHLSWQNPNDQPPAAAADGSDDIICPNCGLFCHSEDESCPNCHFPLKNKTESQPSNNNQRPVVENPFDEVSGQEQSPDFESMFGAIYENDQIGGFAAKDFIFVIRQNYVYFLRVFKILAQRVKAKFSTGPPSSLASCTSSIERCTKSAPCCLDSTFYQMFRHWCFPSICSSRPLPTRC